MDAGLDGGAGDVEPERRQDVVAEEAAGVRRAAGPLARFIERNPSVVMLALAFLFTIGVTLIADGFGRHVPKGYIYAAMAFSAAVEGLNMLARTRRRARGGH